MTTTERTIAVGVFTERNLAEHAIERLHQAGFTNDQIGFVSREGDTEERAPIIPVEPAIGAAPTAGAPIGVAPVYTSPDEDVTPTAENKTEVTTTGVVSGGVVGGILGAAAALLIPGFGPAIAGGILTAVLGGAAIGAVAGGLIGALTNMGVPEEEARFYQDELQAGRTLVTVQAGNRYDEALEILRQNGAYDATTRRDTTDTPDEQPDNQMESYWAETQTRPTTYTPEVPLKSADQSTATEIREPEVPPQPDRVQPVSTNTPPPTYNSRQ